MSFVRVALTRPWRGGRKGDELQVWPNAASLMLRLQIAELVPTVVGAPVAAPAAPVTMRRRRRRRDQL